MTVVKILGQDPAEKKIVFEGCLMQNCLGTNYALGEDFKNPACYKEITLIAKGHGKRDVMLAVKTNGDKVIMFGQFNDGVV